MEITGSLDLTPEEENLLNMHSVLNVMNIITLELLEISNALGKDPEVFALLDKTSDAAQSLANEEATYALLEGVEGFFAEVNQTLDEALLRHPEAPEKDVASHRENLRSIFAVVKIRAMELISRKAQKEEWVPVETQLLRNNFNQFFQAVEKNSNGRYRIVRNIAQQDERDYLVNFDISSTCGEVTIMPSVFQDVIRDLLANARKYTPVGGVINAGFSCTEDQIRFVIEDNGCGIPAEALSEVVQFGYRAQNVLNHPTRGGGFGLTKAYYVTKRYNGRMWIESSTADDSGNGKHGTRITISIPRPPPQQT